MSMWLKTTVPHVGVTIRFEGLTAAQVAEVTKAVTDSKTEPFHLQNGAREVITEGTRFVVVSKSEMKGEEGLYTMLLTVDTLLIGNKYHKPDDSIHRALVQPSRQGISAIFDAAGVLPEKEVITDHRTGKQL